jgi:hypothetical protein
LYKCKYCGNFFPFDDELHMTNCFSNVEFETLNACYSCGKSNKQFSKSQLAKCPLSRCTECVSSNKTSKFAKFDALYRSWGDFNKDLYYLVTPERKLIRAVQKRNKEEVLELLKQGANPNYIRQVDIVKQGICIWAYTKDGDEIPETDNNQPNTPLKLCVFFISDNLLTEDQEYEIVSIAKLLIEFGASSESARDYFIYRYGSMKETDSGSWKDLYDLLV